MRLSSNKTLKENIVELHHLVTDHIVHQLLQEHEVATHQSRWAANYFESLNRSVHLTAAIACVAGGGDIVKTAPLVTSWYLFTLAADIFDDIQDGETEKYDRPDSELLSFALLSLALSYQALSKLAVPPSIYRQVNTRMRTAYLSAASGQLKNKATVFTRLNQQQYLANIIEMSALPLAQYFVCGAYLASKSHTEIEKAFYDYGMALGTCSQLKDDLEDLQTDLKAGNFTLPVLHGLAQQTHPLFQELQSLLRQRTSVARIREILDEMGTIEDVHRLMFVYLQHGESAIQSISHLIPEEALELLSWKRMQAI